MPLSARQVLVAASVIAAAVGCAGKHAREPPDAHGGAEKTSPPIATVAPAAAVATGPCAGAAEGSYRCDGAKVLRCGPTGAEVARTCFDIERCDADQGSCEPACPAGEVYIPPTSADGFILGKGEMRFGFGNRASKNPGKGIADTPHRVVLTRPFCMEENEVTAAAYEDCVKNHGCKPPKISDRWLTYQRKLDQPVNMIDYPRSKYYCEQYGKSLPTEAQWEWAATGGDHRPWPWGSETPSCERADFTAADLISPGGDSGCHGGGPSPVGAHPAGDRIWPTGHIHDLAGNVWEWCLDSYVPYPAKDEVDPFYHDPHNGNYVVRGGGWNRSGRGITTWFRGAAIISYTVPGLGLRCVRNPKIN